MPTLAANKFEPVRVYDIPEVLLTQLFDDELTFKSVRRTLFEPNALSDKERDTFVQRLKARMGAERNPLVEAVVDVATNPWVWFLFVTSPVGARFTGGAARSLFSGGEYGAHIRERLSFLASFGLATPGQMLRGTSTHAVATDVHSKFVHNSESLAEIYATTLDKVRRILNVKNLDHTAIRAAKRGDVERLNRVLDLYLDGRDISRIERRPYFKTKYFTQNKKGEKVPIKGDRAWEKWEAEKELHTTLNDPMVEVKLGFRDVKLPALTTRNLEAELVQMGRRLHPEEPDVFLKLADKMRETMDHTKAMLFLKHPPSGPAPIEGMLLDEGKLLGMWRGLKNKAMNGRLRGDTAMGQDLVAKVLGGETHALLDAGVINYRDFRKFAEGLIENRRYFPRNFREPWIGPGVPEGSADLLRRVQDARSLSSFGSSIPRGVSGRLYLHPDDLKWIERNLGGTEALAEELRKAEGYIKRATERGATPLFWRTNAAKRFDRYIHDAVETNAWFGAPANRTSMRAASDMVQDVQKRGLKLSGEYSRAHFTPRLRDGKSSPLTVDPTTAAVVPDGGFTNADLIFQAYAHTRHPTAQRVLSHVVVPMATGNSPVTHTVMTNLALNMQAKAKRFVDSGLGQHMKRLGPAGAKLVQGMDDYATRELQVEGARLTGRDVAKWLYTSHLGINMPSVLLNIMQPWLLGATWLGMDNIAYGYMKALKEWWGFTKGRARQGWKPLTDVEYRGLLGKTHKYSAVRSYDPRTGQVTATEDLLGWSPNAFETMEGTLFGRRGIIGRPGRVETMQAYMMAPFQHAELINRNTIAHAFERYYRKRFQMGPTSNMPAQFLNDARQIVQETQFGANFMNSPLAFITDDAKLVFTGRMGTFPLTRMFMTFPIRSLTSLLETGPQMAGTKRQLGLTGITVPGKLPVIAHDTMRGMGISALYYELFKGVLGADMSRSGFWDATTDVFSGFVDPEGGRYLIPPIIGIGKDAAAFASSGDMELAKEVWPRVVPGGIALARALNAFPKIDSPLGNLSPLLQRRYADWSNPTPDGLIPVYKADGRAIDQQPPAVLIQRALGVDLGRWKDQYELEGWMVKNREEIVEARRQYLNAMLGNNTGRAMRIAEDYEKRFGLKLTVSKAQIDSAVRLRTVMRPERLLDRIPPDLRQKYAQIAGATRGRSMGVTEEELMSGRSAKLRDAQRHEAVRLDPETLAVLERLAEAEKRKAAALRGTPAYAPFEAY